MLTDFAFKSGPKLYVGFGTPGANHGTTKLHKDVTDAINIMVWSVNGADVAAIWHIFRAHDDELVKRFLEEEFPGLNGTDPIHCQELYLTDEHFARLKQRYNVEPLIVNQKVGDAVLLPARCIHQVNTRLSYG